MFRTKRALLVLLLASAAAGFGVYYVSAPDSLQAATGEASTQAGSEGGAAVGSAPVDPNPAYANLDVRAGVWNDGQAALWDLPFLDQYMIFGPEQRMRGYKPEQPIKFSHVTHVQKNQMDCQYCHWSVSKAAYAAIPEVQTCMGCHGALAPGLPPKIPGATEEAKTEILKLNKYWEEGKPIEWVKVHVMPDYVHFNHKRHVKAGITCQECHGQVPKMEVVERVSSMKMGWCIDCHRMKGASIDCYTCHY
jgi:hypothetical protein